MKRLLPAWLLPLVWSLVGIYGSGALWFYLSRDEYVSAWLAVAGTVVLTLVAIQLHRLTDREAHFRGIREKLAAFAEEASSLVAKSTEQPLPVESTAHGCRESKAIFAPSWMPPILHASATSAG